MYTRNTSTLPECVASCTYRQLKDSLRPNAPGMFSIRAQKRQQTHFFHTQTGAQEHQEKHVLLQTVLKNTKTKRV